MKSTIFDQGGRPMPKVMPVTGVLVVLVAVSFLIGWFASSGSGLPWTLDLLGLNEKSLLTKPWTLITYPFAFVGAQFIGVLFVCYWFWSVGSQLETDLRSELYALFLLFSIITHGLFTVLAAMAMNAQVYLLMPFVLGASVTVLWGSRYPDMTVMVFGIIPVKAKWIAAISVGSILFSYGLGSPVVGVAICLPFIITALYGMNKLPLAYGPLKTKVKDKKVEKEFHSFIDNVRTREKEREERERLRKLFESSLSDEDKK